MIVTYGIMFVCDLIIPMRVTEEEEHMGLDISFHNETYIDRSTSNNRAKEPMIPPIPVPVPLPHLMPPYPSSAGPSIAGPTIAGPTLSGPTLSGPYISGPSIAGPTLSGPSIAGPTLPGPTLSGPTLPGPYIAGPTLSGGPSNFSNVDDSMKMRDIELQSFENGTTVPAEGLHVRTSRSEHRDL